MDLGKYWVHFRIYSEWCFACGIEQGRAMEMEMEMMEDGNDRR